MFGACADIACDSVVLTTSLQLALLKVCCGHRMAEDEWDIVCSRHLVNGKHLLNLFSPVP